MEYQNIISAKQEQIQVITLNRPAQLNALNKATISELSHAMESADADSEVRVIILTGSGNKAFGAGADVKEFAHFSHAEGMELSAVGHKSLFNKVASLGTPVIAAINGYALGGGLELAMSCHIRIAAEGARLGLPEVTLGLIPGYGGTQRLPALVGKGRALELILTGGMIDAQEALRIGLVNRVVPADSLIETTVKLAQKISRNSPIAIRAAIDAVNAHGHYDNDGFQAEIEAFASCFGTKDFHEGTSAFLEKRQPTFAG